MKQLFVFLLMTINCDFNGTRNQLVNKRTFNHFTKMVSLGIGGVVVMPYKHDKSIQSGKKLVKIMNVKDKYSCVRMSCVSFPLDPEV